MKIFPKLKFLKFVAIFLKIFHNPLGTIWFKSIIFEYFLSHSIVYFYQKIMIVSKL